MQIDNWKVVTLGEMLNFRRGHDLPKTEMKQGTIPVVGSNGIIGSHNKLTTKSPCIIIGRSGNIGSPYFYDEDCWAHNTTLYIDNYKGNEPKYLYYLLKTLNLAHYGGGSAVPTLNRNHIHPIAIFCTQNKSEQKAIADILSALDDKIEVNNQISKKLEEMAQAIFKSWFVDFEPFQDGEFEDSELGMIPKGWQVINLKSICEVITKGTTPTTFNKQFVSEGINFVKAESITDNHCFEVSKFAFIDDETNKMLKRSMIKVNDILLTIAGTIGRFALVTNEILPANTNQAIGIIRADTEKINPLYIFNSFLCNQHKQFLESKVVQAVQANLSLGVIGELPILLPKKDILHKYICIIEPILNKIKHCNSENAKLKQVRDNLLPELMNGEIRVPVKEA